MMIDFLLQGFQQNRNRDALVWKDQVYSYEWLLTAVRAWEQRLLSEHIPDGVVAVLEGDFSPNSIALFLALMGRSAILVPLSSSVEKHKAEFTEIAKGELNFRVDADDHVKIMRLSNRSDHPLYELLREEKHPGLVLFSSGSTGKSKAVVHDFSRILDRYKRPGKPFRSISFLLFDHIGGVNTMFYLLSSGGCLVTVQDRSPDAVLEHIEKHGVELLPASPTFLSLILISQAYKRYDLSSLKLITYGTEPMPEAVLKRIHHLYPSIKLKQTYGLSEVGILESMSRSSDSLWVKVGGGGFETRIRDGVLEIKASTGMLGYLNHPSPFTHDGWFNTGDQVIVDGDYMQILGRKSEIINVGGEKVYPTEVENVILSMDNVAEVTVFPEKNQILGSIVCAKVRLINEEDPRDFSVRLKGFCKGKLSQYKVPVKVIVTKENQHTGRFKKARVADE